MRGTWKQVPWQPWYLGCGKLAEGPLGKEHVEALCMAKEKMQ